MTPVCTVVVRWAPTQHEQPTQILALRDELTSREFDDPDRWWPELPEVVGGRDRSAGGTWCATRIDTGTTALVLNRPRKRVADHGAPSRGLLPLLGVQHEADWQANLELQGMASFLLVLSTPQSLTSWDFDGDMVTTTDYPAGTHMFTSGGAEDGKAVRYLERFRSEPAADQWLRLVEEQAPADDLTALVVRHELPELVFATVFGQLIEAQPGHLRLQFSREPWIPDSWQARELADTP